MKLDIFFPKRVVKNIFKSISKNKKFAYSERYNRYCTNYIIDNDLEIEATLANNGDVEIFVECIKNPYINLTYYFNEAGEVYQNEEDTNEGDVENIEHAIEQFIYDLFEKVIIVFQNKN